MQKKKNGFLLFIFSFCPGAGELYMGFMKMGLSLLTSFFLSVFVVSITNTPELSIFPAIIYIYSFFHAHNIASLDDEKFYSLKDEYLLGSDITELIDEKFKGKSKVIIATILIILGFIMMWNTGLELLHDYVGGNSFIVRVLYKITDYAPRFIIGVVVVICGFKLIKGKNNQEEIDGKNA